MTPHKSQWPVVQLEQATEWCIRLSEEDLTSADSARLQAWIEADQSNGAALEEVIATWSAVETHALAPELIELRREALAEGPRAQRWRAVRLSLRPSLRFALAATFAVVFVGASLWWVRRVPVLSTDIGERRVAMLADGSRVSLDASTQLDVNFTTDQRHVLLERGRAKFDVAKNPLRPFAVDAGDRTIVAVGTSFSVELLNHEVRVILYEGHVAVLQKNPAAADPQLTIGKPAATAAVQLLDPGETLVVADGRIPVEHPNADAARSLSWEGGLLAFDDEPLASAVERINRYTTRKIEIIDPSVSALKISGLFAAGDIDAFIDGITAAFPLRVRETSEHIELLHGTERQLNGEHQ